MGSLDELVHDDPEAAWPLLVAGAGEPDPDLDKAAAIECLIDRHGERFVVRIEAQAREDRSFALLFA